jgi:hypothetical protein
MMHGMFTRPAQACLPLGRLEAFHPVYRPHVIVKDGTRMPPQGAAMAVPHAH